MSKARQLADNGAASPNRNMVINGAMNVAQRATSVTGIGASAGYFTLDRFNIAPNGTAGRLTMTQTADGPVGFANCLKLDCTTADTSIAAAESLLLETRLEGQNLQRMKKGTSSAEQTTVSFYVKGNASATYVVELMDEDNSYRHINKSFAVTTAWTRVSLTIPGDTTGAFGDDNGYSLGIKIWLHAGSNFTSGTLQTTWGATSQTSRAVGISSFFDSTDRTFLLTGLQFEVGDTTPFEHKTFAEDLAECQRYYYEHAAGINKIISNAAAYTSSSAYGEVNFPTAMRAEPSLVVNEVSDGYNFYRNGAGDPINDFILQGATKTVAQLYNDSDVSATVGHAGFFWSVNSNCLVAFQSEL